MTPDRITETLSALADPTRRAILARLAEGEASVTELSRPFTMSQPAISRHIKVLEQAGLVSRSRRAQFRPCRLEPRELDEVTGWIAELRRLWEARFDRLEAHLERMQAAPEENPR